MIGLYYNAIVIEEEKFYDSQLASNGFHGGEVLPFNEVHAVCVGEHVFVAQDVPGLYH